MAEEIWKAIPGYEGFYEASTHGNLRALDRIVVEKTTGKVKKLKARYLTRHRKQRNANQKEYYMACLCKDGKAAYHYFHTLIALTFIGPRPEGTEICHGDGNRLNNAVENLRYGTITENRWDSHKHKTDRSGWHKLSVEDVEQIKVLCRTQAKRKIANMFGVTRSVVNAISDWDRWEKTRAKLPEPEYHI